MYLVGGGWRRMCACVFGNVCNRCAVICIMCVYRWGGVGVQGMAERGEVSKGTY
jgi:hypothetical protein